MMALPHMLAGAAIGKLVRRPWVAYPAALASHFVLDVVPHLDPHGMFGAPRGGLTVSEATVSGADFVLAAVLITWLAWRQPERGVILGAAFCAIIIDLVNNVPPWGHWFRMGRYTGGISTWHHGIQHNLKPDQWPLGISTQLVVCALSLWAIWPRRGVVASAPSAVRR